MCAGTSLCARSRTAVQPGNMRHFWVLAFLALTVSTVFAHATGLPNEGSFQGIRLASEFQQGSTTGGIQEGINSFGVKPACGTVIVALGVFNVSSTIDLSGRQGCRIIGMGSSAPSELDWTGSANGIMFLLDGSYYNVISGLYLNGESTAGIAFNLQSSAGSTCHNRIADCKIAGFSGSPGYAFQIGVTAVANVSENEIDHVVVYRTPTLLYQDGAQSFTWVYGLYSGSGVAHGVNVRSGWLSMNDSEISAPGTAIRIGQTGSKVYVRDFDWESTGELLVVEDGGAQNVVDLDNVRALYRGSSPGTIIQFGVSTGTLGSLSLTNCKFSILRSGAQAAISINAKSAQSIKFDDSGTIYNTSPSATVLSFPGAGAITGVSSSFNSSLDVFWGKITMGRSGPTISYGRGAPSGPCVAGSIYMRTGGGHGSSDYFCEAGRWAAK